MDPIPDGAHAVGAPLRPPTATSAPRPPRIPAPASTLARGWTTRSLTELPYHRHIQHEHVETTQMYLHADLALKERALDRTKPLHSKPGRYRPPDALLGFLDGL